MSDMNQITIQQMEEENDQQQQQVVGSPQQQNDQADNDDDGLNPPSRRHVAIIIITILAFAMYISSAFEPFVSTKSGKSGIQIDLWQICNYNATTDKFSGCENAAKSDGYYCGASKSFVNATRAFMILCTLSALLAGVVASAVFLGSTFVAKHFKVLSWVTCFCGLLFGIIYLALQVGFGTSKVCDNWTTSIVDANGGDTYRVGSAVGFSVVGIVLMFIAQVLAAIGVNACLDAFCEPYECCDDGTNGGRNSNRRRTTM